jgi:hypothetical protein
MSAQGSPRPSAFWTLAVVLAALTGLALLADGVGRSSATYDEVAYLRVASRWWRTGDQEAITRMGSPLTFWKLQQGPVLWLLDRLGRRALIDDPIAHQATLLPLVRLGSLWIWLAALALTATWSRLLYGPRAMALAAWLFAMSPNLLAHGGLATMELPLLACTTASFLLFWGFLRRGDRRLFRASAALAGLAWSCKFTAALLPPLLAAAWWLDRLRSGGREALRQAPQVGGAMIGFVGWMALANLLVTGFALLPPSERTGHHPGLDGRYGSIFGGLAARAVETPLPQDWVGFAVQVRHQRSGGPSYLFGERRMRGWWYYYLVALAVKVPLSCWLLLLARARLGRRASSSAGGEGMIPSVILLFLLITALGSSRNYGFRYLLPLAPLAIVWISALAEGGRIARAVALLGLLGQAGAVATAHPHELAYFNALAGGPAGGRRILADSNLDWGQGARGLARLQRRRPEFRDLTLYYFGDTDPGHYGVVGHRYVIDAGTTHPGLPPRFEARTRFVAVSASLQFGPWGPAGYFRPLDGVAPACTLDDCTIAIYRTADRPAVRPEPPSPTDRP